MTIDIASFRTDAHDRIRVRSQRGIGEICSTVVAEQNVAETDCI